MANSIKQVLSDKTAPEADRIPKSGLMPRVSDTLISDTGGPDADYHAEALANAVVDNEAGTMPDSKIGGIVPLKRKPR